MIRFVVLVLATLAIFRLGGSPIGIGQIKQRETVAAPSEKRMPVGGPASKDTLELPAVPLDDLAAAPEMFQAVELLAADPRSLPEAETAETEDGATWEVTAAVLQVHAGPSDHEMTVGTLRQGDRISLLFDMDGRWALVRTRIGGMQGFVDATGIATTEPLAN
ncbi:MAG: hypothetical protein KDE08_17210 [Rhodobacteraceae bacterium]|nr:hypothetical protein [Paracoccaceae bacterium]